MGGIIIGIVATGIIAVIIFKIQDNSSKRQNNQLRDDVDQLKDGNTHLQDQMKTLILIVQSLAKSPSINVEVKAETAAEFVNNQSDSQVKPEEIEAIMIGNAETIVTETGLIDPKTNRWFFLAGDDKKHPM